MRRYNLIKLLIISLSVVLGTTESYGSTEVGLPLNTDVQPAVAITVSQTNVSGNIDPATGNTTGVSPITFRIQTNGDDRDYDFIMTSALTCTEGEVSAFDKNGNLMVANTTILPTKKDIDNAYTHYTPNRNVIVYPLNMTITEPMTMSYNPYHSQYKRCYVVRVNSCQDGKIIQTLEQTPINNTYKIGEDDPGSYIAVVTLTAVSK